MKKTITLLLALMLALSLVACGGNSVDKALQGSWHSALPGSKLIFDNGSLTSQITWNGQMNELTGTYEIKKDVIVLHYDHYDEDDVPPELSYTMDGDTLIIEGYTKE